MSDDLDDLARTAAEALVSAMMTDSWEAVKDRFVKLVGRKHERRMDAARAEIAAASGADRGQEQLAQARAWGTRLRDSLDDDPNAVQGLRALLAELRAPSPGTPLPSQHVHADHGSRVINAGNISNNRGDIIAGDKVQHNTQHNTNLGLAPFMFIIRSAKKAAQHPIAAAATAAVVLGSAAGAVWQAPWHTAVPVTGGTSHSRQAAPGGGAAQPSAARPFGDIHSRWQLHVQPYSSVGFAHGLVVMFEPDSSPTSLGSLIAYHEDTGTRAWSLDSVDAPGSMDPLVIPAGVTGAGSCPQSVTRVNPSSGATMWTAQISDSGCGRQPVAANDTYVVVGHTVLSASNGVTLQKVATGSTDQAVGLFGNGILVQDDKTIEFDALQNGALQQKWHRAKGPTYWAAAGFPDLWMIDTEDPNPSQILNPATGAITGTFGSRDAFPTPQGITEISPSGHFLLLSPTGATVTAGPKVSYYDGASYTDTISYSGGIFWQYLPPDGLTRQKGVDAVATLPGSFKDIGRLVLTASQLSDYDGGGSAAGTDQVGGDGQYAVILAQPWIYAYKL
jgi:hypothetical protein